MPLVPPFRRPSAAPSARVRRGRQFAAPARPAAVRPAAAAAGESLEERRLLSAADLIALDFTAPAHVQKGEEFTVGFRVVNVGLATAGGSTAGFSISAGGGSTPLPTTVAVPALGVGASVTLSAVVRAPAEGHPVYTLGQTLETATVGVEVDVLGEVTELNELNNLLAGLGLDHAELSVFDPPAPRPGTLLAAEGGTLTVYADGVRSQAAGFDLAGTTPLRRDFVGRGDFDGDGYQDLVRLGDGADELHLQLAASGYAADGLPDGVYDAATEITHVAAADLDGSGADELLIRDGATGWWTAWEAAGGSLSPWNGDGLFARWSAARDWEDVRTGDFDGDGADEVLARPGGSRTWLMADANGLLTRPTTVTFDAWGPATYSSIGVGDLDLDGTDDLIGRREETGGLVASLEGGAVTKGFGTLNKRFAWDDVSYGDFTGDGRLDIAARKEGGDWFIGASDGGRLRFSRAGFWRESFGWTDVRVLDFNGDGRDDLVGRVAGREVWYASTVTTSGTLKHAELFRTKEAFETDLVIAALTDDETFGPF